MSAELVAIGFQIAFTAFSALAFVFFYKREKKEIIEKLNIENIESKFIEIVDEKFNLEELKVEFTEIVDERLQTAIDNIGESLQELFLDPTVKKAFGIIGSQGGEARAQNIAVDDMAKDIIDGPQFAAIKMGAEALGLDIDGYIEKHGALKSLQAAKQLADFAGIDVMNLQNLSLPQLGSGGSGDNPYRRR